MTTNPFENVDLSKLTLTYGSDRDLFPKWYDRILRYYNRYKLLLLPSDYRVKFLILQRLYTNHVNAKGFGTQTASEIQTVEMTDYQLSYFGLTKTEIREHYRGLLAKNEIGYTYNTQTDELKLHIDGQGIVSASTKAYYFDGKKEAWERLYNPLKVFAAVFAIVGVIVTVYKLKDDTRDRLSQMEKQIDTLKQESLKYPQQTEKQILQYFRDWENSHKQQLIDSSTVTTKTK